MLCATFNLLQNIAMRLSAPKRFREKIMLAKAPEIFSGAFLCVKRRRLEIAGSVIIIVSKKCGKATSRNRIRRIIRNWLALNFSSLPTDFCWAVRVLPTVSKLSSKKKSQFLRAELAQFLATHSKNTNTTNNGRI